MKEPRSPRLRLRDILDAIGEIEAIVSARTQVTELGKLPFNALLYSLLKISEASRHLPDDLKARRSDVSWSQIAALGNRLRHGYFRVDPAIIAAIIAKDVPELKNAAEALWREFGYGDLPKFD